MSSTDSRSRPSARLAISALCGWYIAYMLKISVTFNMTTDNALTFIKHGRL